MNWSRCRPRWSGYYWTDIFLIDVRGMATKRAGLVSDIPVAEVVSARYSTFGQIGSGFARDKLVCFKRRLLRRFFLVHVEL